MNKRLVLLGVVVAGLAATLGTAQANHSGPELRTFGRAEITFLVPELAVFRFDFDARLGPHEATDLFGEPHGHMKLENLTPGFTGTMTAEVTCLTVVGNLATVAGRITRSSGSLALPAARGLIFDVADNTLQGGVNLVPDQLKHEFTANVLQVCPAPTGGTPISDGNIVVEQN